jgi:uncharacterized protein (UPF0333 family)
LPERKPRRLYARPVKLSALLLLLAILILAGCGGGTKPSVTNTAIKAVATSRSPDTVATCLNGRGFLVDVSPHRISGSSPGGVNFAVTFFANAQAADVARVRHHYVKRIISTTTNVGIDDTGNPPAHPGGKPMTLPAVDLHTIVVCILHG